MRLLVYHDFMYNIRMSFLLYTHFYKKKKKITNKDKLLNLEPSIVPKTMMFYFEKAAVNASKLCFHDVLIRELYFQKSQSIWK